MANSWLIAASAYQLAIKEFELYWGAVFFKDLFAHFHEFWSQIELWFGHAETGSGAKKASVFAAWNFLL